MGGLRPEAQPGSSVFARLVNAGGELIVEGACWLDERAGTATLEPAREPGTIQKERGALRLELETGRTLRVSDRPIVFKLRPQTKPPEQSATRTLYRLRLLKDGSLEPVEAEAPLDASAAAIGYKAGVSARTNGHWPATG
ncbi:MAG: hypothetical protein WBD55_09890 [Dehalococcoidia bacterium]